MSRPLDGSYYAEGNSVWRNPLCSPTGISMGFRVCTMDPNLSRGGAEEVAGALNLAASIFTLHPAVSYHEDHGVVLWHHLGEGGICEAPFCGHWEDMDAHRPWEGYYTHWSRLPSWPEVVTVEEPKR